MYDKFVENLAAAVHIRIHGDFNGKSGGGVLGAGAQLKELRSQFGITLREVEEQTRQIAEIERNEEYYISKGWIYEIENTEAIPSVFKLYSLSILYHVKFTDLLLMYGVDLDKISKHQMRVRHEKTHLTDIEVYDRQRTVSFPVRFDRTFSPETTTLISRMVEIWGEVPMALLQHLDLRQNLYGYVGLKDFTLYPILRPGTFVQIDERQRTVENFPWRTELDRPIYFVEVPGAYACSWCEQQGDELLLLPHPLSMCSSRSFALGEEAEIVGRVTAIAMRIVSFPPADEPPRLPKQS